MKELADVVASLRATFDQEEMALGELLGIDRQIPFGTYLLVSPDVGMRLTRDGVIPSCVRISWWLEPRTALLIAPPDRF